MTIAEYTAWALGLGITLRVVIAAYAGAYGWFWSIVTAIGGRRGDGWK